MHTFNHWLRNTTPLTLLLLGFCLVFGRAYAGEETFTGRKAGTELQTGTILEVKDGKYAFMQDTDFWQQHHFRNAVVKNRVYFGFDRWSQNYTGQDFTAEVTLSITAYEWETDAFVAQSPVTQTLSIDYSSSDPYKAADIYQFEDAHRLVIEVTGIETGLAGGVPENLYIKGEIAVQRNYNFDPGEDILSNYTLSHNDLYDEEGALEVYWEPVDGAEAYDLEWTYINNYTREQDELPPVAIEIESRIFDLNSTRITTAENHYRIPLIYDQGYILYRIRPIGRKNSDYKQIVRGRWSSGDFSEGAAMKTVAAFPHKYKFQGHEPGLNWQSTVNYAEEGKNKAAVTYFDGSLRNRQTVSKINSKEQIIVGETFYDYQGREAVNALPVPKDRSKINFVPDFNLSAEDGEPFGKEDFDEDTDTNSCVVAPGGMSTESGASHYYSPENPDAQSDNYQQYLPDAAKYPYTQKEYTPDNTGRVRAQSGVGETHKIGSGHETRYVYGKPFQQELDRMFGVEAGYASHYKKNLVIDANGQVTVKYLDPQGRTIATALAGNAPENLEELDSPNPTEKTVNFDLLDKKTPDARNGEADVPAEEGRGKLLNRQIPVSTQGERLFDYELHPERFHTACNMGDIEQDHCYNCVVDLEFSLTNQCGEELFAGTGGETITFGDTAFTKNCDPGNTPGEVFTLPATDESVYMNAPGKYQLSRKITVNEQALNYYTEQYLNDSSCVLQFNDFFGMAAANADTSGCGAPCEDFRDSISYGTSWENHPFNPECANCDEPCSPCMTEAEYEALADEYETLCLEEAIHCQSSYTAMLSDMSPFGQYGKLLDEAMAETSRGQIDPDNMENGVLGANSQNETTLDPPSGGGLNYDPGQYPLSIFNSHNKLPANTEMISQLGSTDAYYRNPVKVHYDQSSGDWNYEYGYFDENGQPATVRVTYLGNNETAPEITGFSDFSDYERGDAIHVPPEQLANLEDFVAAWEDSWAESLVAYHPEFAYYRICRGIEPAHDFESQLLEINTLQEAEDAGILAADGSLNNILDLDPYFNTADDMPAYIDQGSERSRMSEKMTQYEEDPQNSGTYYTMEEMAYRITNCPGADNSYCGQCQYNGVIGSNAQWQTFRSLYLSERQSIQDFTINRVAIAMNGYNGCIGNPSFDPYDYGFVNYDYSLDENNPVWNNYLFYNSDYYHPYQPCTWWRHVNDLFEDKTPRFGSAQSLMAGQQTGMEADQCYAEERNDAGEVVALNPIECPVDEQQMIDRGELKGDYEYLERCGQCPLEQDLENFIDQLGTAGGLDTSDVISLSCYPAGSDYGAFVPDLEEAVTAAYDGNGTAQGPFYWENTQAEPAGAPTEITGEISDDNGAALCTIKLIWPDDDPGQDDFFFGDMYENGRLVREFKGFCCLDYEPSPDHLPLMAGKNFRIVARYHEYEYDLLGSLVAEYPNVRDTIEGVTGCLNIDTCSFPPFCETTNLAPALNNLFNGLLNSRNPVNNPGADILATGGADELIHQDTSGGVQPVIPYQQYIDDVLFRNNFTATHNWYWNSNTASSGTVLNATLRSEVPGNGIAGECPFDLNILINDRYQETGAFPQADIQFGNVVRLMNPRVSTDPVANPNADPQFTLLLTAQFSNDSGDTGFFDVEVSTPCYQTGRCKTVSESVTSNQ